LWLKELKSVNKTYHVLTIKLDILPQTISRENKFLTKELLVKSAIPTTYEACFIQYSVHQGCIDEHYTKGSYSLYILWNT
jgi:hypothetical protein